MALCSGSAIARLQTADEAATLGAVISVLMNLVVENGLCERDEVDVKNVLISHNTRDDLGLYISVSLTRLTLLWPLNVT